MSGIDKRGKRAYRRVCASCLTTKDAGCPTKASLQAVISTLQSSGILKPGKKKYVTIGRRMLFANLCERLDSNLET